MGRIHKNLNSITINKKCLISLLLAAVVRAYQLITVFSFASGMYCLPDRFMEIIIMVIFKSKWPEINFKNIQSFHRIKHVRCQVSVWQYWLINHKLYTKQQTIGRIWCSTIYSWQFNLQNIDGLFFTVRMENYPEECNFPRSYYL